MNDNYSKYKTYITGPREFLPFKQGTGQLQRSIAKYIQLKLERHKNNDLQAFCTYIQPEEERFFNENLFKMFIDSDYDDGRLFEDLGKFSKSINKSNSYVNDILRALTMIRIKVVSAEDEFIGSASSIFMDMGIDYPFDYEKGKYNENLYFLLRLDSEFYQVCMDVQEEL